MNSRISSLLAGASFAALALSSSVVMAATGTPDPNIKQAAQNIAKALCSHCHGSEGRSDNPLMPRIAGQQQSYIEVQLKAFRNQSRGDPEAHDYMWGIAAVLNDQIIDGLSEYFSAQTPAPGIPGDPALIEAGKSLYEKGDPGRGIPACAACHLQEGQGLAVFPRLAGQQGQYLYCQMQVLQKRLRDSPVMHGVIKEMKDDDMRAIATYLQSK
jgi:cytochrome c553